MLNYRRPLDLAPARVLQSKGWAYGPMVDSGGIRSMSICLAFGILGLCWGPGSGPATDA